jgi:predicted permease
VIEEPRWRRYLRLRGTDVRADVDDELSFHLEELAREYREQGVPPEEALRRARERFGDHGAYEQACIAIGEETMAVRRRRDVLDTLGQDMRFGMRQLLSNRTATATALLTIALGIGAVTAIFSVVNAVLIRPLPYHDVDRLMAVQMSVPEFRELRARQSAFEELTIWASNLYTIADEPAEDVLGATVEPGFFPLLMQPVLGRSIAPDEARSDVAVISDGLWARRFNRSPDVLGRTVTMSGRTYSIVGVMPPSFQYPDASFDIWVPFEAAMTTAPEQLENRQLRIFRVVGRLKPGATTEQAVAGLRALSEQWEREYPETNEGLIFTPVPLADLLVGEVRPRLTMLLMAVTFVLLIACVNVANLLLGATARRNRELAVRRAIGAPGWRLVRQLLTESVVLALLGAAGGVALAVLALQALPYFVVDVPRINEVSLDARVLLFTLGAAVVTALLFGIVPALRGAQSDVQAALREAGRGGTGSRGGGRLRSLLVAAEVCISVVVLVGAGLLLHSLARVANEDIGIAPDGLSHANVGLFYFEAPPERVVRLASALERVSALDGVTRVAASSGLPPQTAQRGTGFTVPGRAPDAVERDGALWMGITPAYFATVGGTVIAGRDFDTRDRAGGMPVAMINQTFARALFGANDPIGRQLRLTNPDAGDAVRTIVGVVNDIRYSGVEQAAQPAIYTPFAQTPFMWAYLMIRSRVPAEQLTPALRQAIAGIDPRMVPTRLVPQQEIISSLMAQRRFITTLLGSFAALALALAAIGVYGVTATAVTERSREIGVRMALGARPGRVLSEVLRRALALVLTGIAAGVVAAFWVSRLLDAMLYEVEPRDPATYVGGVLFMILAAVLAALLPAFRASRIDPMRTLRTQ